MKLGLIGLGVVGSTLQKWLTEHTQHTLCLFDPPKGLQDELSGCEAIFISVPVPAARDGQDLSLLREAIHRAKQYTNRIFIRSTVLPGTCDELGVNSMPEFLTERRAYEDFCELPVIVGIKEGDFENSPIDVADLVNLLGEILPRKPINLYTNVEAELAKFTHNCFGVMKVTYFNMIYQLCKFHEADFNEVKDAANITGFLGSEHLQVPGPDGKLGYGGKCFPENMDALHRQVSSHNINEHRPQMSLIADILLDIKMFNTFVRHQDEPFQE